MIEEYFKIVAKSMKHRQLRSWLTIVGIVIGVAAIVSLMFLGQGLEDSITASFSRMGTNRIMITPKGLRGPPIEAQGLTRDDVIVVEKIDELEYVTPLLWLYGSIEIGKEKTRRQVRAFPTKNAKKAFNDMDMKLEAGRYFNSDEKYAAMVGYRLAKDYFKKEIRLKNKIKIEGKEFRVVGIFEETGDSGEDYLVTIPIEAAREIFAKPEEVSVIMTVIKKGVSLEKAKEKINKVLKRSRGESNFEVITPQEIQEQVGSILGTVKAVLIGIATISLLVGAIGILNSMYTSVLERTREIGIMKAIGATNKMILSLFLLESGLVGFVGGVLGVLFGTGIAKLVEFGASQAGFSLLKITIDIKVIIFALLFSFVVGVLSGIMPAYKASKMNPVDSLRYE